MKTAWTGRLALCAVGALSLLFPGCSPPQTTMTPKEVSEFKGGPMPESARRIMVEQIRQAQLRAASQSSGKR